jgi:hypothetical protein
LSCIVIARGPLGEDISDINSTLAQVFGSALAFLSHLRRVDVGETEAADGGISKVSPSIGRIRPVIVSATADHANRGGRRGYRRRKPSDHSGTLRDRKRLASPVPPPAASNPTPD